MARPADGAALLTAMRTIRTDGIFATAGMLAGLAYGVVRGAFFTLTINYAFAAPGFLSGRQHALVAAYLLAFYIPLGAVVGMLCGAAYRIATRGRSITSRIVFWECLIWGIVLLRFGLWLNRVRLLDYWILRVAIGPFDLRAAWLIPAVWLSNAVLLLLAGGCCVASVRIMQALSRGSGAREATVAPILFAQCVAVDGYAVSLFEMQRLLRDLYPAHEFLRNLLIVLLWIALGAAAFAAASRALKRRGFDGCIALLRSAPAAACRRAVLVVCLLGLVHFFYLQQDRHVLVKVYRDSAAEVRYLLAALDRWTDFDGDGYSFFSMVKDRSPFNPRTNLPPDFRPGATAATGAPRRAPALSSAPGRWNELVKRTRALGRDGRLTIMLVVADSLRPDRLGFMGAPRNATPCIDAFSREATVFTRAYAQSPSTFASVPSLLLSSPSSARRTDYYREWGRNPGAEKYSLVEPLRDKGFQTVFLSAFKFRQILTSSKIEGFGIIDDMAPLSIFRGPVERMMRKFYRMPADLIREEFFRIRGNLPSGNAFFYLHFCEPHPTQKPLPAPFDTIFGDLPGREDLISPTPEDIEYMKLLYDRRLAYLDDQLSRIIDRLKADGSWDRTLFILTADHGDKLGEHAGLFHGSSLYDEEVHIPLLIRLPGQEKGAVANQLVQLMDIMPTVLDLAGIPPAPSAMGASLVPLLGGEYDGEVHREIYLENTARRESFGLGIIRGDWKYTYNLFSGKERLFNLAADPHENNELCAQRPDMRDELKKALLAAYRPEESAAAPPD